MNEEFSGKSALVTGAASGIGLAVATYLSRSGAAPLILTDRIADTLTEVTAGIAGAVPLAGHVADEGFWHDAAPSLATLDLAVINAGVSGSGPIDRLDIAEWRRIMSTNLDGTFLTLRSAIRAMKAHGRGGSIVIVASASGLKAEAGIAAYGASKAGALHLMRIAAKECAADGIRINAIAPAGVTTPIWRQEPFFNALAEKSGSEAAAFAEIAKAGAPLGRLASAEDIAGQIAFLLSNAAATITGATLTSDGGYLL